VLATCSFIPVCGVSRSAQHGVENATDDIPYKPSLVDHDEIATSLISDVTVPLALVIPKPLLLSDFKFENIIVYLHFGVVRAILKGLAI
jgi:hypothetical protein